MHLDESITIVVYMSGAAAWNSMQLTLKSSLLQCRASKRKMPESQEPWADMTQDSGDEGNSDDTTPPSPGELLRQHKQRAAAARNKPTAMPAPSASHRPVASQQQQSQRPTVTANQGRGRFQTMTMSVHSGAVR